MGRIGVDEAGKGDYFGYLVVAAVYVDEEKEKKLKELNVRDSKKILDVALKKMAKEIKKICPYSTVMISPEKYNILQKKFRSLNELLAWSHATAICNLMKEVDADFAIIDKFGDEKLVKEALEKKKIKIKLVQKEKAESDIAVAAASVIARAEFLSSLRQLSLLVGYKLPKGATHVDDAAKEMIKRHGSDILEKIAKVHFKNTKRIKNGN